jgi:23S rRNA pseudouridine2605 synthase
MLDPDDNKEWQQRDEAGRRYRPSGNDNAERPRRPRGDEDDNGRRGEGRRSDAPRGEGVRRDDRRGSAPRGSAPREFRKPGRDGEGGGSRFRSEDGRSSKPRSGNSRFGEGSSFGRDSDDTERGGFNRRFNSDDDDRRGGDSSRGYGARRDSRRSDDEGFGERRSSGPRSAGPRSAGPRTTGSRPGGNRYGEERSETGRSAGYGNRRNEGGRSEFRPEGNRSERGGEFRSERPEGNRTERRSNTGRRGEARFESQGETPRRSRKSGDGNDSEGRESTPFKKKTFSERKSSSTATPPTYDFSKIKPKDDEKAAHTDANIRLNKYIADAGICSRRDADELIASGQIKVNGEVVTQMGHKVSRNDKVTLNGKKINPEKLVYVLLNKPKDFITTTEDPQERKTVMQLVNDAADQRIYPVGRLDRNTTGLLLLTNDGELAEKLSHPSHKVKKVYQVLLDKPLEEADFDKIQQGIELEDGPAPVDEIGYVIPEKTVIGVEIHIGRNRIVRRIFESLGYEVLGLDRVIYAGLTKLDLPRGHWRYLSQKEVIRLKHFS